MNEVRTIRFSRRTMMALSNPVHILLIYLSVVHSILMPPTILTELDPEVVFDSRVNTVLPCSAKDKPAPTFIWAEDG